MSGLALVGDDDEEELDGKKDSYISLARIVRST